VEKRERKKFLTFTHFKTCFLKKATIFKVLGVARRGKKVKSTNIG